MLFELFRFLADNLLFFALQLSGGSFPQPLDAKRERECFCLMRGADPAAAKAARGELIEHNLRLVAHIVKKFYSPSCEQDDLISTGTVGLIKAVDTFDIKNGTRFATYAARCIENEILMEFRSAKKDQRLTRFNDPLDSETGDGALTVQDVIRDEGSLTEDLEHSDDLERLGAAVRRVLFGREKIVIAMRYGLYGYHAHTQQETASALGISRSYISRIEKRALSALRKELDG